jgi:hypothetical protein
VLFGCLAIPNPSIVPNLFGQALHLRRPSPPSRQAKKPTGRGMNGGLDRYANVVDGK